MIEDNSNKMIKKVVNIMIIITFILFMCWYIPVSYMNVYACDDFWFGTNVHNYGFWGTQVFYWINWEGSYTHTFLASLPLAFNFDKMPFICNIVSFSVLYLAILFVIETFSSCSKKTAIINSLAIIITFYIFTLGEAEIRFWVCAGFTYQLEMAACLFFISLYHLVDDGTVKKYSIPILLFSVMIAGSKLIFISYAFVAMVFNDVLYRRKLCKYTLFVYLSLVAFSLLNIMAPGNYIRLKEETLMAKMNGQMSIFEIIIYRIQDIARFSFCALLLFPISLKLKGIRQISSKHKLYALLIILAGFLIESIIMYVCFHDPGPKRVYIIAELTILILVTSCLGGIYKKVSMKCGTIRSLPIICCILLGVSNTCFFKEVRPSIEYSIRSKERDEIVRHYDKSQNIIDLPELPESHLLLSYFANDKVWIENVYLPYFNKSYEVNLIKE